MAIVINTAPTTRASVNNEMLFVVYEATKANDDITYPDYRYVCDVYVGAVFVGRIKSRPDPTHKRGVFDVSAMLRSYVTYGLKATYANNVEPYTVKLNYTCKFGEEYADTLYTNVTIDTERLAYTSYEVRPFDESNVMSEVDFPFTSSMPATIYSYKAAKWQLMSYWDNVSGVTGLTFKCYNSVGSQVGSTGSVPSSENIITGYQINAGFAKLAGMISLSQSQQDSVEYMEIIVRTKIRRIQLTCSKYPLRTIAWLNKFGMYDSYSFGMVSMKQSEIQRKEFQRLNYSWNASGVISYESNGVYYGGKRGFATDIKTTMKLTSHLLNDDEYAWMSELFHSSDAYMYNSDMDKFMPVSIQENSYEYRTYLNSRQKALEFNVVYSDNSNAQFL